MGKAGKREYVQKSFGFCNETFDLEVPPNGAYRRTPCDGVRLRLRNAVKHDILCCEGVSSAARPNSTWISIPPCLGPTWRPRRPPVI